MLKANVGLSRKVSENFNSAGFSLNIESEILASIDDPEMVIQRIRELYDLADEALQRQIEGHQSDSAIASRDADPPSHPEHNGRSNDRPHPEADRPADRNGKPRNDEPATNKQIQFLITLAKRRKLFGAKLEAFIEEVTGHRSSPYDLSKKQAGLVIDQLSGEESESNRPRR